MVSVKRSQTPRATVSKTTFTIQKASATTSQGKKGAFSVYF